jgi:hemolysin III
MESVVAKREKPLLRGWLHAGAAVASVGLTVALCVLSRDDPPRLVSMLVFGLSMMELYTVSAFYHIGRWGERTHRVLRAVDHSNIYVLIAGTYTPLCFNVLDGWARVTTLTVIWSLAALGVGLSIFVLRLPRRVGTGLYIAMGWVALLAIPAFLERLPWQAVATLLLGGVLYTVGGVIYARKRPDPLPRVLGFHEVFHLFVIAGSVAFAIVVWVWVLPFPRA